MRRYKTSSQKHLQKHLANPIFFATLILILMIPTQMATANPIEDSHPLAKIDPVSSSVTVGNKVNISVYIDSAEQPVLALDLHLYYPAQALTVESMSYNNLLGTAAQVIDASGEFGEGDITISLIQRMDNLATAVNGSLYTICFTGLSATGTYYLSLNNVTLKNETNKKIQNIAVTNGTIDVKQPLPLIVSCSGPQTGSVGTPIKFFGNVTGGTPPYTYQWNFDDDTASDTQNPSHEYTRGGTYEITLTVTDTELSTEECTLIVALVSPGNTPPRVAITAPRQNGILNNTVLITGTASDTQDAIQMVQIRLDKNPWIIANGTTDWSYVWETTIQEDGNHTITARSYDGFDYSRPRSIYVVVNNKEQHNNETPGFILALLAGGIVFAVILKKKY